MSIIALDAAPLERELKEKITREGSISVADYMEIALQHPEHGYYINRDPFGSDGDFTTSPEISQLFGEMIGAFIAAEWMAMGKPEILHIVECGPGRGTLMADALRVFEIVPDMLRAVRFHLIETSPRLRDVQKLKLQGRDVTWHDDLTTLPEGQFALVANEFLDALPIEQYVFEKGKWHERRVGIENDALTFVMGTEKSGIHIIANDGNIFERSRAREVFVRQVSERCAQQNGFALFIDYGHARGGIGDTLQAMRQHQFVKVLQRPGEADITSHVDFGICKNVAEAAGCDVYGPMGQGTFLQACGIEERAAILMQKNPNADVASALKRLTSPEGMGELFKAMAVLSPNIPYVLQT